MPKIDFLSSLKKFVRRNRDVERHLLHKYFALYGVDFVFDIGANTGQSANFYRNIGYRGNIVSYEPIKNVSKHVKNVAADPKCLPVNMGVSDAIGSSEIYVTDNGAVASSFLHMTHNVIEHAPEQQVVRTEIVKTTTLETEIEAGTAQVIGRF